MYECTFADLTRTVLCSCSWCPRLLPGAVLLLGVSWCSTAVPRLGSMMQRVHWALLAAARLGAWVYRVSCKTPIDLTEVKISPFQVCGGGNCRLSFPSSVFIQRSQMAARRQDRHPCFLWSHVLPDFNVIFIWNYVFFSVWLAEGKRSLT